jgi:hypothetical protein
MESSALLPLITGAVSTATEKVLKDVALPPAIKTAQAIRMYGRRNVERWLAEGLVITNRNKIDRQQIAAVAGTSNRLSYRKVTGRSAPKLQTERHD